MDQLLLRDCPQDHQRLERRDLQRRHRAITIDACPRCHGVYLDRGELARVVPDAHVAHYFQQLLPGATMTGSVCPGCGGLMRAKVAHGVESDVCEACAGVWLANGALEALSQLHAADVPDESREEKLAREAARYRGGPGRRDPSPAFVVTGVWAFLYMIGRAL